MGDFEANLNYTRNIGGGKAVCIGPEPPGLPPHVKEQIENNKKAHMSMRVTVKDARKAGGFNLETHGFTLQSGCRRKLTKQQYYQSSQDRKVMEPHNQEVEEAIAKAFGGGCKVTCFHHLVRSSDDGNRQRGGPPAGGVHCDYSVQNALSTFDMIAKGEQRDGRFAVVNTWRNIADTPIERQYLAVCDGRSVTAPDDFVQVDVYNFAAEGAGAKPSQSYHMDPSRVTVPGHRWWYYPAMKKDDILIFMQYDSHVSTPSRYCFHTAVPDPRPAYKDKPPRESCESRCLVFFPGFKPNSIPEFHRRGDETISVTCHKILTALNHADHWPEDGRRWMADGIWNKGAEKMANEWIRGGVGRKEHGLDKLKPAQVDQVIKAILADGSFEKAAKANFPRRGASVEDAVAGIISAVAHGDKWDAGGKGWAQGCLRKGPAGVAEIANGLVEHKKKSKENGLHLLSDAQRKEVVTRLLSGGSGFEATARKAFKVP